MNLNSIVIIDDEEKQREGLRLYINRLFPEKRFEIHLCSSVKEGVEVIEEQLPDLVFLDIEMPEANGFELFHRIKKDFFEVVFVTAYSEFMEKSINEIGCFGYLLKPVDGEKLKLIFERFEEKKPSEKYMKLVSSVNDKKRIMLEFSEVMYVKAQDRYCHIFMNDGQTKHFMNKLMKDVEDKLPTDLFKRVNRSTIVNMNYVKSFDKKSNSLILNYLNEKWESEIRVTDSYKEEIRNMFL